MKRLLFVFLDGVGIGPGGPQNPLDSAAHTALRRLAGGRRWTAPFPTNTAPRHHIGTLDATLAVDGLPQSGTGQGTMLTGHNCAALVGRHFGPYPHSSTHDVLDQAGLFQRVQALDLDSPAFANAFPPQYFDPDRRHWESVTTRCVRAAGLSLRDLPTLLAEEALAADLTGQTWRDQLNLPVPLRREGEAARVLADVTRAHGLTFFEYFLTDKVGHKRIDTAPAALLSALDQFFDALLNTLNPSQEALLVTSDHGNLEDTSHTQHTRHPVPLLVYGWAAPYFAGATSLTDVTPGIVEALRAENGRRPTPSP